MKKDSLFGTLSTKVEQLTAHISHTSVIGMQINDLAIWEALSIWPDFRCQPGTPYPLVSSVIDKWRFKKHSPRKKIFIFGKGRSFKEDTTASYLFEALIHIRTPDEMQKILDEALVKSVLES
jgi:hypothetical protein